MIDAAVALAGVVFVGWLARKERIARLRRMRTEAAMPIGWYVVDGRWRYGRLHEVTRGRRLRW